MSGMVLQYNSPEIYILGSTNKIQELNMDGLFVSPAGRELMKQKSQYHHHKSKIKHSNEFSKTLPTLSLLTETTDIRQDIAVIPTIYTNEDNFKKNSLDIVPITATSTIADCIESTSSTATSSYYSTPSSTSCCSNSMKINNNNADNDDDINHESCSLQSQSKHAKNNITTVEENENSCDEKINESECNRTSKNYYEEELELLLGINCVLEDDCRCFECQSTYFDYTEDDDFEENLESIKNPNNTPPSNSGSCRRHHTNHATNMYCCIQ